MEKLEKPLNDIFGNILSRSSQRTYKRALTHFRDFTNEHGFSPIPPICSSKLILFIAYLRNKEFVASTISTYVSAIGFIHKINHLPDPTDSFLVQKVLHSIHKNKDTDTRLPITSTKLIQLVNAIKHTLSIEYDRLLITAMFTLAYHALLRIGEMTVSNNNTDNVIKMNQILVTEGNILINFVNFKHSNGKRFCLEILKDKNETICAVLAIKNYLKKRNKCPGPLFLNASGQPVCRKYFQNAFNNALNFCGFSSTVHKPHSFRIGFATDACIKGMSSEKIKLLGRWKSDAFKLYIRQYGQISNM